MHVHVISADGEAQFWLEPVTESAQNWGLAETDLALVCQLIGARRDEICAAWQRHFG
jgi:hypothetical protein